MYYVGLPLVKASMEMVERSAVKVEKDGVDLLQVVEKIAQRIGAFYLWGTPALGEILVSLPIRDLMDLCVNDFVNVYGNDRSV